MGHGHEGATFAVFTQGAVETAHKNSSSAAVRHERLADFRLESERFGHRGACLPVDPFVEIAHHVVHAVVALTSLEGASVGEPTLRLIERRVVEVLSVAPRARVIAKPPAEQVRAGHVAGTFGEFFPIGVSGVLGAAARLIPF